MPRTGQIVPEYLVPHVKTYINDNSSWIDPLPTNEVDGVRMLCVFASSKGEDGVLKKITSVSEYINEYGTPNYNLYGQPGYMPYAALSSGNARCFCMRVMPETATYSNIVISAHVVNNVQNETTGAPEFRVKFIATPVSEFTDKSSLLLQMQNMAVYPPNSDGVGYLFPLFAVNCKGRGQYGNSFRIRVVSDTLMNNDNNYMNYIIELLDSSNGTITLSEQFKGCFNDAAVLGNTSLFLDDVLSDTDSGSKKIDFVTCIEGFDALYTAYNDFMTTNYPTNTVEPVTVCDLFTGTTKNNTLMEGYVIDSAASDFAALDSTVGIQLNGGDDSTFAADYTPTEPGTMTRQDAIDDAYIRAFRGEYDSRIRSKRAAPCELILDANYSETVKLQLVELALHRYDARCVIDAGLLSTTSAATNWVQSETINSISDFIISKECQHYKIRDPFTGRAIAVTATYFIAQNIPTHYSAIGNHVPFVGNNAQITNNIKNSIKPHIDADDFAVKETLYTNHCNFFECIAEDTYVRGVQTTSQTALSDLSEENNVTVLLEMKRMLEEFVSARLYNFASAEDRVKFTEDATRMFSDFRGTKVSSYDVYFEMNAFEEERSILHCYLSVVFRTLAKRGIIEIDINKRS